MKTEPADGGAHAAGDRLREMPLEEEIALLDSWSLQEAVRVNRDILGRIKAGWERAINTDCNRAGFRGVLRQGRKVIWRSTWVSIHVGPFEAWQDAHNEQERRVFDAWKAEKGLK